MELLIDVGNSRVKWRWWDGNELEGEGRQEHDGRLPDGLAAQWAGRAISQVRVSCVAPPDLAQGLRMLLAEVTPAPIDWLRSPGAGLGLINSYAKPEKLGIDRWLALAAARQRSGQQSVCVVDVGTAITVDIADQQGRHAGGLIAAGPGTLLKALRRETALPQASDQMPAELGLGTDTEDAILLGVLHQCCGLIERGIDIAISQYRSQRVFLTGGGGPLLRPYLKVDTELAHDLVFEGLVLRAQEQAAD